MRAETEFLTDMLCENEYHRKTLQKIINNFEKKTRSIDKSNDNTDKKQTFTFLWIPKIEPKIKKERPKSGFRVEFQKDPNIKNILCKSKDKLTLNSHPGVCYTFGRLRCLTFYSFNLFGTIRDVFERSFQQ